MASSGHNIYLKTWRFKVKKTPSAVVNTRVFAGVYYAADILPFNSV